MPNDRFYRIDTALLIPSVDTDVWTLRIHGLVDRETTLTWDELIHLPMFEQYVTISCVSNEVGGKLVGNAKWTGVRLRDVLAMAGVQAGATQLVGRSVDGWTAGMPMEWVMDPSREPMIAVKMNDEALPADPRLPGPPDRARAVRLRLGDEVADRPRGHDLGRLRRLLGARSAGPRKDRSSRSRASTRRRPARPCRARSPIAGVAWAPGSRHRRRSRSRSTTSGRRPRCRRPISDATWVQWVVQWDVTPGDHTIRVRATDGTGETQTEAHTPPAPDGARGWDMSRVRGA